MVRPGASAMVIAGFAGGHGRVAPRDRLNRGIGASLKAREIIRRIDAGELRADYP